MVRPDIWFTFVLAATVILIVPGPTIILVISQAVSHGKRSVIPLVVGVLLGDFTAMVLSFLGLGALLSASASLFTIFKWIGALYLLYLGVKMWTMQPIPAQSRNDAAPAEPAWILFKRAYIVTTLNPKSIGFFVAFLPQFVDPARPVAMQFGILGTTFLVLATINAAVYALFAGRIGDALHRPPIQKWFNRCGGGALIGAGIITARLQR